MRERRRQDRVDRKKERERERERERESKGWLELKKGSKKLARLIDRLLSGFQFPSSLCRTHSDTRTHTYTHTHVSFLSTKRATPTLQASGQTEG